MVWVAFQIRHHCDEGDSHILADIIPDFLFKIFNTPFSVHLEAKSPEAFSFDIFTFDIEDRGRFDEIKYGLIEDADVTLSYKTGLLSTEYLTLPLPS